MKHLITPAVLLLSFAACAADVGRVIVRQQWPWSTAIKVEFELSNVTDPVDISLKAYNGTVPYDQALVDAATVGPRFALTKGDTYTLTLDPAVLFADGTKTVPDFKVTVTATTAEESLEVLYKIVNLESPYDIENVTRAALLNGEYGTVETDYGKVGAGFSTGIEHPVIWTGVTNNLAYKTTHMVLRKIPSANQTYPFRSRISKNMAAGGTSSEGIPMTLAEDFYIGVFEVTQSQFTKIRKPAPAFNETNMPYAQWRPADRVSFVALRGDTNGANWPEGTHADVDDNSFFKIMQDRYSLTFDLPTAAMWEFACCGGVYNEYFYSGLDWGSEAAKMIMRVSGINTEDTAYAPRDCTLEHGPNVVGSYLPNAYGLYDMLGNVYEWCLDRYSKEYAWESSYENFRGPAEYGSEGKRRTLRGACYYSAFNKSYTSIGGASHRLMNYDDRDLGFRVALYIGTEL